MSQRASTWAFAWTAFFVALHGYRALGGNLPDDGWVVTAIVIAMSAAGLMVPAAVARGWGGRRARRILVALMWAAAAVLAARGAIGLLDDLLRGTGLLETGLTGPSDEQWLGTADPSTYTMWSTVAIDAYFAIGGSVFAWAACAALQPDPRPDLEPGAALLARRELGQPPFRAVVRAAEDRAVRRLEPEHAEAGRRVDPLPEPRHRRRVPANLNL
jgi:hypothetical protein